MWGEPERALRLEASDALAAVLFQITGPAHVPWTDPRWSELWHGYPVWVHVEMSETTTTTTTRVGTPPSSPNNSINQPQPSCLQQACQSMVQHAPRSSNLAAMAMHVTRMLREITITTRRRQSATGSQQQQQSQTPQHEQFSKRIALVGQAQAMAGALNLFRILCHAVLVHAATTRLSETANPDQRKQQQRHEYIASCFTFTSRDASSLQPVVETSQDLLAALVDFLFVMDHHQQPHRDHSKGSVPNLDEGVAPPPAAILPELYDATVLALQLLLVLFAPQLYQPMQSSFQRKESNQTDEVELFFWDIFMRQAQIKSQSTSSSSMSWTPASLLCLWFTWQMERPEAPTKSIARHNVDLAHSVVHAKGETPGPDGMYESYLMVQAVAPPGALTGDATAATSGANSLVTDQHHRRRDGKPQFLLDATKGVLVFSSSIILLPFRLVSLAFHLWGHKEKGYDTVHKQHLQTSFQHKSRTKDVLWLSDSPVADMASCLLLLAANNDRADPSTNPFRVALASLSDNRWDANGGELPDLPDFQTVSLASVGDLLAGEETSPFVGTSSSEGNYEQPTKQSVQVLGSAQLSINFEALFGAFGRTAHSEVGAFLLYTLLQTSKTFADSIAVRSDLDTLVLPLLRTLYFACAVRHYVAQDFSARRRPSIDTVASGPSTISIRNCPFRSSSQLYLIIILLLLFSQDPSFGPDAFRRVMIPAIPFYKERNLKDISLGSVLILSILRCLTFNLHRLGDPFLLSNCCAILMNLSPSITDLYDYSAMRLASITFSFMKKYATLKKENPKLDEDVDFTSPTAMYGEVSRTLLRVLKQCVSSKNVEGNLRLVYSLVYHQTDFHKIVNGGNCPFGKQEYRRVQQAIQVAASIIEKADARTATKALKVLAEQVSTVREAVSDNRKRDSDDFTFTYEEEADPEIFFVPYLWEVIVCAVTASSIEWQKNDIQIFPLLDIESSENPLDGDSAPPILEGFSQDVSDVV